MAKEREREKKSLLGVYPQHHQHGNKFLLNSFENVLDLLWVLTIQESILLNFVCTRYPFFCKAREVFVTNESKCICYKIASLVKKSAKRLSDNLGWKGFVILAHVFFPLWAVLIYCDLPISKIKFVNGRFRRLMFLRGDLLIIYSFV